MYYYLFILFVFVLFYFNNLFCNLLPIRFKNSLKFLVLITKIYFVAFLTLKYIIFLRVLFKTSIHLCFCQLIFELNFYLDLKKKTFLDNHNSFFSSKLEQLKMWSVCKTALHKKCYISHWRILKSVQIPNSWNVSMFNFILYHFK